MNASVTWVIGSMGFAASFGSIASNLKMPADARWLIFTLGACGMALAIFTGKIASL